MWPFNKSKSSKKYTSNVRIAKWKSEGRECYVVDPRMEKKMCVWDCWTTYWEREQNLRRRVFSCWNAKTKPPLAGHYSLRVELWFGPLKRVIKTRKYRGLPGHTPVPRQAVCWLIFFHRLPLRIKRLGQHWGLLEIGLDSWHGMNLLHKEHYRFLERMLWVKRGFTFNQKLEIFHGRVSKSVT